MPEGSQVPAHDEVQLQVVAEAGHAYAEPAVVVDANALTYLNGTPEAAMEPDSMSSHYDVCL